MVMNGQPSSSKSDLRMLERFLQAWDPIGVIDDLVQGGNAPDEYDSYAPRLLQALMANPSTEGVVNLLAAFRSDMGLKVNAGKDHAFAAGVILWWSHHRDSIPSP